MKISNETLTVLKNFASINSNLVVREGNVLATVSPGKNILARATVAETFPREFAIYDLSSLLGLLTLLDGQEVEFGESQILLHKDGENWRYDYSDPSVVTAAPDKELEIDPFYTFTLTAENISMIHRNASIFSAPTVSVVSTGGKVILRVGDPANANSNSYSREIGTADVDFDCRLKIENLKVLSDNYEVRLGRKKAISFRNVNHELVYFIAMDPSSTVPSN